MHFFFTFLTLFFIVMPYIGIALIPFDVQPFALILSSIMLFALPCRIQFDTRSLALLAVMILSLCGFYLNSTYPNQDLMYDIRSLFGYISAVVVYMYVANAARNGDLDILPRVLDCALVVIGIGLVLNLIGLSSIVQIFVNRSVFDESTVGARGLTSFFPEQSRIAGQAIYLLTLYYACHALDYRRAIIIFFIGILSGSGQFFVNAAVLAICMALSSLPTIMSRRAENVRYALISLSVIIIMVMIMIMIKQNSEMLIEIGFPRRGIIAFSKIVDFDFARLGQDVGFLFKVSGPFQGVASILTNPLSIRTGYASYIFYDYEIYRLYFDMLYSSFGATEAPLPPRSYSVLGAWWSDFRLYGLVASVVFIMSLIISARKNGYSSNPFGVGFLGSIIFLLLIRSNTSDPTLWASIASIASCNHIGPRDAKWAVR